MTVKPTFWQWFWRHGVYVLAITQWGWVTVLNIRFDNDVLAIIGLFVIQFHALFYILNRSRKEFG